MKKEMEDMEYPEPSDNSCGEDEDDEEYNFDVNVIDDEKDHRYNNKRVRIRQTDGGESVQVLRLKLEDKKFGGNCVRQANAILYISSVINARNAFLADMWSDMSNVFLNCAKTLPQWRLVKTESLNISRWLNTNSIKFCILSEYNTPLKLEPYSKKSKTLIKPLGRPKKTLDELKVPRNSRYVKKSTVPVENPLNISMENFVETESLYPSSFEKRILESVSIFCAKKFQYDVRHMNLNGIVGGLRVKDLSAQLMQLFSKKSTDKIDYSSLGSKLPSSLPKTFYDGLRQDSKKPNFFQALFCGGPVSAIATCPRRSSTGDEVVAIATFSDEKLLSVLDNCAHIQFWSYSSDLKSEAKLKFILEIPDVSSILCLCWCPCFTNDFYASTSTATGINGKNSQQKNQSSTNFEDTKEILGLLAVSTNAGKILIYCIPKNLDDMLLKTQPANSDLGTPRPKRTKLSSSRTSLTHGKSSGENDCTLGSIFSKVLTTEPKFVLHHPVTTVRVDEGNHEIFFKKVAKQAKNTAETSASVVQSLQNIHNSFNVLKDINEFPIFNISWSPFRNGRMIAGVSAAGRVYVWDIETKEPFNQPLIIYSSCWTSPPMCVDWFSASDICISFRQKCARVYNIETELCTFKEDTSKSAGQMVVACPTIFPGFFIYDTHYLPFQDIFFSCLAYFTFPALNNKRALLVPTLNSHQVQVARARICETTGCVASVGVDGRLVSTLNGRIVARGGDKTSIFNMGRTHMQLVSHRNKVTLEDLLAKEGGVPKLTNQNNSNGAKTSPKKRKSIRLVKNELLANEEKNEMNASSTAKKNTKEKQKAEVVVDEQKIEKLCFTHPDCIENKWLEIRIGDATLKDQLTMRRMKSKISDVNLDRRLESLTYTDYSHLTPCLSVTGGEAGLVFLMHCIL